MIIFCGDQDAYDVCSGVPEACCVLLSSKTGLHRYTIPLALLNLGVDTFVIDFDIYPFKNLTAKLVMELESYGAEIPEFLVGGSFGDACICNAFAFYKNTKAMRDFTRILLAWLYEYPFPHGITQKALSAFLGEEPLQKIWINWISISVVGETRDFGEISSWKTQTSMVLIGAGGGIFILTEIGNFRMGW